MRGRTGTSLGRAAALAGALASLGAAAVYGPASAGGEDFKTVRECLDLMYYDQAVRLLGNILAEDESARDARYWQGLALARLGRLDQAMIALKGEIERYPDHWPARTLLAYVYDRSGRSAEAEAAAQEAAAWVSKKKPEARAKETNAGLCFYVLGMIGQAKGRFEAAEDDFAKAISYGYEEADARLRILGGDLLGGSWDEAKAAKAYPSLASAGREYEYHILAAAAHGRRGEVDAARKSLEAAYLGRPFEAGILSALGCGYAERGDFAEAEALFGRAERLSPENLSFKSRREDAEKKRRVFSGEFEKRLNDLFDEVLSGHPPVFRYIFYNEANKVCGSINQRFLSFVQGGLFSDAAALVKSFIENADVSSTLNYNLGQLYNSLGQFRAAFPYAFQAARQKKDYRDALDLLGGLYFRIGDFDRSVEYYERAREQSPEDPVSNFHLALALKVKGKDVEAEKLFLEAIRNENVGLRQEKKAQTEPPKSTLDYSLTIREEAITFFARMKLGEIALARREFDQAGVHFNEAARMSPKSPEPYYELARLYSISVQSEKIKYYLGLYLSLGGDEAKARALLEKK